MGRREDRRVERRGDEVDDERPGFLRLELAPRLPGEDRGGPAPGSDAVGAQATGVAQQPERARRRAEAAGILRPEALEGGGRPTQELLPVAADPDEVRDDADGEAAREVAGPIEGRAL